MKKYKKDDDDKIYAIYTLPIYAILVGDNT